MLAHFANFFRQSSSLRCWMCHLDRLRYKGRLVPWRSILMLFHLTASWHVQGWRLSPIKYFFSEIDALVRELANILWQMNEICSMYLSNSETESQKEEEQECVWMVSLHYTLIHWLIFFATSQVTAPTKQTVNLWHCVQWFQCPRYSKFTMTNNYE